MTNSAGIRVAQSKTRNQIRKEAFQMRRMLGYDNVDFLPIMDVLEFVMPIIYPEFCIEVVDDGKLKGRFAETNPEEFRIRVRNSVYDGACNNNAWARMIMAHELGHFLFHNSQNTTFAYIERGQRLPGDVDPERQADIFAAEFLIPINRIKGKNEYQVSKHFGVSRSAARNQLKQAQKVEKRHNKKKNGQTIKA